MVRVKMARQSLQEYQEQLLFLLSNELAFMVYLSSVFLEAG